MKMLKNIYDILIHSKLMKEKQPFTNKETLEENLRATIELSLIIQNNLLM